MKCEQLPGEPKPQDSVLIHFLQKPGIPIVQELPAQS